MEEGISKKIADLDSNLQPGHAKKQSSAASKTKEHTETSSAAALKRKPTIIVVEDEDVARKSDKKPSKAANLDKKKVTEPSSKSKSAKKTKEPVEPTENFEKFTLYDQTVPETGASFWTKNVKKNGEWYTISRPLFPRLFHAGPDSFRVDFRSTKNGFRFGELFQPKPGYATQFPKHRSPRHIGTLEPFWERKKPSERQPKNELGYVVCHEQIFCAGRGDKCETKLEINSDDEAEEDLEETIEGEIVKGKTKTRPPRCTLSITYKIFEKFPELIFFQKTGSHGEGFEPPSVRDVAPFIRYRMEEAIKNCESYTAAVDAAVKLGFHRPPDPQIHQTKKQIMDAIKDGKTDAVALELFVKQKHEVTRVLYPGEGDAFFDEDGEYVLVTTSDPLWAALLEWGRQHIGVDACFKFTIYRTPIWIVVVESPQPNPDTAGHGVLVAMIYASSNSIKLLTKGLKAVINKFKADLQKLGVPEEEIELPLCIG